MSPVALYGLGAIAIGGALYASPSYRRWAKRNRGTELVLAGASALAFLAFMPKNAPAVAPAPVFAPL